MIFLLIILFIGVAFFLLGGIAFNIFIPNAVYVLILIFVFSSMGISRVCKIILGLISSLFYGLFMVLWISPSIALAFGFISAFSIPFFSVFFKIKKFSQRKSDKVDDMRSYLVNAHNEKINRWNEKLDRIKSYIAENRGVFNACTLLGNIGLKKALFLYYKANEAQYLQLCKEITDLPKSESKLNNYIDQINQKIISSQNYIGNIAKTKDQKIVSDFISALKKGQVEKSKTTYSLYKRSKWSVILFWIIIVALLVSWIVNVVNGTIELDYSITNDVIFEF